MMYAHSNARTSLLVMLAVVASALFVRPTLAQEAQEQPIQGTIEVAEDADFTGLAQITLEEARTAALEELPGSTFSEGELDEEDGFLVYEIEVMQDGQEFEILVDAGNGSILEVEREDEDDDDDDDD